MIKFLLGLAIVCLCTCFGYLLASNYRNRKHFYKEMRDFNERFLNEISYYKRPLGEFIIKYKYNGYFELLIRAFQQQLNKSAQPKFVDLRDFAFLKKEETGFIDDYFQMLGRGDSSSQKAYFSAMKEEIQKRYNLAESEYKKYGDLYIKLGFLCGLFLLILIV